MKSEYGTVQEMLSDTDAFLVMADGTYASLDTCVIIRIPKADTESAIDVADRLSKAMADDLVWSKFVVDSVVDIEAMYRDYSGVDEEG